MALIKADCNYVSGMKFEGKMGTYTVPMDAKPEFGGQNGGPTPKELLLQAIMGCSGMDIVSLLKKMRVEFSDFKMNAETETTSGHPAVFKTVFVSYFFTTSMTDATEKIKKAVLMSMSKYCGVSAMISKNSPIDVSIFINGEKVYQDMAQFIFEAKA